MEHKDVPALIHIICWTIWNKLKYKSLILTFIYIFKHFILMFFFSKCLKNDIIYAESTATYDF